MKKYYDYQGKEITEEQAEEIKDMNEYIFESVQNGAMDFGCLKFINFLYGFKNEE